MSKVLIAEDDTSLCNVVVNALTNEHFVVEFVHDGASAWQHLKLYQYDALILDWDLPVMTGLEVCRKFRHGGGATPILMFTGKSRLEDKAAGFEGGADDYLTKPFELQELLLRLKALLRRPSVLKGERLAAGAVILETDTRRVTKANKRIELQPKEFAILEFLMRNRGAIFSAEQLLKAVWTADEAVGTDTVRTHIKKLRAKLDDKNAPSLITNVFSVGYKIE